MNQREPTEEVSPPRPSSSQKPLGRYEIIRPLANGGMAKLFLARTRGPADIEGFEKQVVIKKIRPEFEGHELFIDMLLDEARLAATLDHHNIAHVYDVGRDEDGYYLAMEYLRGHDARQILRRAQGTGRTIPTGCALAVVSGLAAGLGYAHEQCDADGNPRCIVHRDVSPGNAFVTFDGGVKLLDFGIARATSRTANTQPGMQKGKVSYMSPEQCAGRPIDHRSDIFSLGIVLYELTTVRAMYPRAKLGDYEFMKRIVKCRFKRPSEVVPSYPPKLEAIVMRALAPNPDDRYQSAFDLAADLEEFARREQLPMTASSLSTFVANLMADASDRADTIPDPTIYSVVDARLFAAAAADLPKAPSRPCRPPTVPGKVRAASVHDCSFSIVYHPEGEADEHGSAPNLDAQARYATQTGVSRGATRGKTVGSTVTRVAGVAAIAPWLRVSRTARVAVASLACVGALGYAVLSRDGGPQTLATAEAVALPEAIAACADSTKSSGPADSGESTVMPTVVSDALAPKVEVARRPGVSAECLREVRLAREARRGRKPRRPAAAEPAQAVAAAPTTRGLAPARRPDLVRALANSPAGVAPRLAALAETNKPAESANRRSNPASSKDAADSGPQRVARRNRDREPDGDVKASDDLDQDVVVAAAQTPSMPGALARKTAVVAALNGSLTLRDSDKGASIVALVGEGQPLPEGTRLFGFARRRGQERVTVRFKRAVFPSGTEVAIAAESSYEVSGDELFMGSADVVPVSSRLGARLNDTSADAGVNGTTMLAAPAKAPRAGRRQVAAAEGGVRLAEDTALRIVLQQPLSLPE